MSHGVAVTIIDVRMSDVAVMMVGIATCCTVHFTQSFCTNCVHTTD